MGKRRPGWHCGTPFVKLLGTTLLLPLSISAATGPLSRSDYRAQLLAAQQLVAACQARADACRPGAAPANALVAPEAPQPGFQSDWQWLRDSLAEAAKVPANKQTLLRAANSRLAEELAEVAPNRSTVETIPFPRAHAAALRVLARAEFHDAVDPPTWFDRQLSRLQDAVLGLFAGVGRFGSRNPWIAPVLEWLGFGLALAGLFLLLYRGLRRQSLRLALAASPAAPERSLAPDWAALAEAAERDGHWREALHSLYWAAIAGLEARRLWRANPTRTPRETLRLLHPGTEAYAALRALTRRFERSWYGFHTPDPAELGAARQEYATLLRPNSTQNAAQPPSPGDGRMAAEGTQV